MSVSVTLYQNDDNELIANKTLSGGTALTGSMVDPTDFLTPTFTIDCAAATVEEANYLELTGAITRYFFIEKKVAITDTLWQLSCRADVRHTYYYNILGAEGIVCRQENNYDMYLPDNKIPTGARKSLTIKKFPSTPYHTGGQDGTEHTIVTMLVLGGGEA